jgi:hypothetical protein
MQTTGSVNGTPETDQSAGGGKHAMEEQELRSIIKRFAESEWELISAPAIAYLSGEDCNDWLVSAIEQANEECGSCGCDYDELYRRFLELKYAL